MKRANCYDTGIASEYHVLSLLYRQGYEAYMSSGNRKGIDIRVIHNDKTISIDVKAVQGYSSLIVNNVKAKEGHYIIFLIYNNKFADINTMPELYVVPSANIEQITKTYGDQKRICKRDLAPYKDYWNLLFSSGSSSSDQI